MVVDDANPWMYCTQCHDYYVPTVKKDETSGQPVPKSVLRVPMRNRLEALYTRWHMDLGFVHMREELLKIFPKLEDQLPTADEVLHFHEVRNQWVKAIQDQALPIVEDLRNVLDELEFKWAPPPHRRADMGNTPIPASYFRAAAGGTDRKWDLRKCFNKDLVSYEQGDLVQDMPSIPALQQITSCEARACISLCRPEGRYVEKRQLKGKRAPVVDTQRFHAGEYSLRPLTSELDEARGFVTGVVASEEHLKEKFHITLREAAALKTVLPHLRTNNPWHAAYKSSLGEVHDIERFIEQLKAEGCLAPLIPKAIKTEAGAQLQEQLGEERTVLFVPEEIHESRGNYEKIRACARAICRANLQRPLPAAWQQVHVYKLG